MQTHTRLILSAVAALFSSLAFNFEAGAQDDAPESVETHIQLERREPGDDVPAEPARASGPRAIITFGEFISVQANVNAFGGNIFGDAANEPSLAVDRTAPNRIAVGWRQFDTINSSFREAGFSYSIDGGRTWAPKGEIDSGQFRSDPVLAEAPDGTLYYLSLKVIGNQFSNDIFVSEDGGATWPVQHFAVGGDKAWLEVDPNNGALYQAWNVAGNQYFPAQFSRSLDGGKTWMKPIIYDRFNLIDPARPSFGILDTGPDGELYVAGARNSQPTNTFWVVRSNNPFLPEVIPTFPVIRQVDLGGNLRLATGPNPAGLLGQINVSVDHSDGPTRSNVYVLGSTTPPIGGDPMDIFIIRSTDGGMTWDPPVRVNDDSFKTFAWQWFGTMDVAPNGRIDVVWNDTRNSGLVNMSQLYYSFSIDGGQTWSVNEPVSPEFNSHVGWPQQAKLGDYYDMVSDATGAHVIYAATFNMEQDVYYLRIGDYDCNGNGIGDSIDISSRDSADCNENEIPDECEIAALAVNDLNDNGVPDGCECLEDIAGPNNVVDIFDLLELLAAWGTDAPAAILAEPFDVVDEMDLVLLLDAWGACD